jgi:uncharacterized protein (TIGR00725 family)
MNITIFGGSQPHSGSPSYLEAYELGKILADLGHTVLTGGYIGTMEAVSRGANEAGGHVIGVTCATIEAWRAVKPNAWVNEIRHFNTLLERINELILSCDAALALPGGPGTLTEIALTWNMMIIRAIPLKPLILIGPEWKAVLGLFHDSFKVYIPQNQSGLLQFAHDIQEAVWLITHPN